MLKFFGPDDIDKAIKILNKKGLSIALKKATRAAKEGLICSYIHHSNKIGVLVEVNCETDFVARNEDFKNFVKDVAMQIAAYGASFVKIEDVSPELIEDFNDDQKKDFHKNNCLMEQAFIKDQELIMKDYLTQTIAKIGENIIVRRFTRYQVGEKE